jgi:hypothetical protein
MIDGLSLAPAAMLVAVTSGHSPECARSAVDPANAFMAQSLTLESVEKKGI